MVSGLPVQIIRKPIKNLHLGVYPPLGRVRVAAPFAVSDSAVRVAVIQKLSWIKRMQRQFEAQPRQSEREMLDGETHYFQGRPYRLRVVSSVGVRGVFIKSSSTLELHVPTKSTATQRELVLEKWYRDQLKDLIPVLLEKWQPILGVEVSRWGVRKMKTKWGSCNSAARRIWLNLELMKKPRKALEYIVVHELIHLRERNHNGAFLALMDKHMPKWRFYRQELNASPLGHEKWAY